MISSLVDRMLSGDRRALARLFTLIEGESQLFSSVMSAVYPHAGDAYCIGVTGPPGAGKSTIVDGLVRVLRDEGTEVGVLAVDPTSPFSGGAVLGDRIRMQRHYLDQGVFIRSLATRGAKGGLSRVAAASVKLLDASGKDVVVLESVGVGQTELDIMKVADTVVVTLVPETGDAVQMLKAGLMEIADIFVVNKADREGATRLLATIKSMLSLGGGEDWWRPPVLLCQARKGEGIDALNDEIGRHRLAMEKTSNLERRRRQRQRQEFVQTLADELQARIGDVMSRDEGLIAVTDRIESGELDPYAAASQVLGDGNLLSRITVASDRDE